MNVYKLTSGKVSGAYQLPIKTEMIAKMVDGEPTLKRVHYIPGSDSIFVEDYKGDEKSKPIWFDDGEIRVAEDNRVLNTLLQKHSWFNKHYVLVNEEETAKKEVGEFETLTKASNSIITEKDEYKLQAMAMIIITPDASNWKAFQCKSELLKYAKNHSKSLLFEMAKPDYESRLIAALSFNKGIVKYNSHRTAVVWNDTAEGIIVRVAEGENGIDRLGEYLSKESEAATSVLQRIGEKTEASIVVNEPVEVIPGKTEAEIRAEVAEELKANSKTEEEIRAEIRAEMELKYAPKTGEVKEPLKEDNPAVEAKKEGDADAENLEKLKEEYKTVTGKDLSPRYYNDVEWISKKIAEAKVANS